jgi:TRAP transporter 4TM/12TM fusion protein
MNEKTPQGAGKAGASTADEDLSIDYVAEAETGARQPAGAVGKVLIYTALAWALFQLWVASPLPFMTHILLLNEFETRAVHLAFAIFLAYTAFPALKSSPRDRIPLVDWGMALVGCFCAAYPAIFYADLATRPGNPITMDIVVGVVGMLLLLEATRRALGPPLMVVAAVFLIYTFAGPYMPDVIAHKGASLSKGVGHYWLGNQGVYGVALGVSTSMVFLFVLFGSLLEKGGAGNYFIRVAFALLGHMRGGPAKAAVVSSAMTGLVSGSSIANVVTTGTFTIPLMKKVGFPAEKAGAVEVASSVNGQMTPPVMGAAAFLMVEYVGISYVEVMKHAIVPALICYIALVYIVHLEAMKMDLKGLPRRHQRTWATALMGALTSFLGLAILSAVVYYGLGWTKDVFGDATAYIAAVVIFAAYVGLLAYSLRFPPLEQVDTLDELPEVGPTVKAGLYYLLPVAVLVWCLMIERMSPGLAAFWAAVFMAVILGTQRALRAWLQKTGDIAAELKAGLKDLFDGMVAGSRNMVGIGVATAAAGVVVGTVTLTGIGLVMTEFVELISAGNLMLMLIFTALISLILGMGLPTTANYIVVSTLMAPVIVNLGAEQGLLVPLIAVHMFVFYFGILADDTPPVGLAAFAAAAIAKSDPIRTGIQGFTYDIRTATLPFMFIFNNELLLIGVTSWAHAAFVFVIALAAMMAFAAATQRWFLVRCTWVETFGLLLIAFTLFRPGFWWDMIYPPLDERPGIEITTIAGDAPAGSRIMFIAEGETLEGDFVSRHVSLPLGEGATGAERLAASGLELRQEDGKELVDSIVFGSAAEKAGLDFDWQVVTVLRKADTPPREIMYIPALLLYAGIYLVQRRRRSAAALAA